MKASQVGNDRVIRLTGLVGKVRTLDVRLVPVSRPLSVAQLLDQDQALDEAVSAIVEAINSYRPKPKRDPDWAVRARAAVAAVARRMECFTTDDVWDELAADGVEGGDPRAMGPVMNAALADEVVGTTEEMTPSRRRVCHGRPIPVWVSRVVRKGKR